MSNSATDANPPPPQDNIPADNVKSCSVIELSSENARLFFLESKSYCDLDIPSYISFFKMLAKVAKLLGDKTDVKGFLEDNKDSKDSNVAPQSIEAEKINHVVITNKDGGLAWRPISLIHPVLYVLLVNLITKKDNWVKLQNRFKKFSETVNTECHSLPRKSYEKRFDKSTNPNRAQLVSHWWERVEQRALDLALEYSFVIHADIANCYGSIYTHSIPWALHGKEDAKNSKNNNKLLGNNIDKFIRDMSYGQTNGIPQGSSLMDFIAEIVLGYIDEELKQKIDEREESITSYHILRYRDDYRVFTNNPSHAKIILQCLSETLRSVGMKLNDSKTKQSNDTISASIKPDKLAWLARNQYFNKMSVQKKLLAIYTFSLDYPNSGTLSRALTAFFKKDLAKALKSKGKLDDRELTVLISIIVTLAHNNPRVLPVAAATLSHLLSALSNNEVRALTMEKIERRLKESPNTGQLELWIQRINLKQNITTSKTEYKEPLCKILAYEIDLSKLYNQQERIEQEAEEKLVPQEELDEVLDPVQDEIETLEDSRENLFDTLSLWDSSWLKKEITKELSECTIFGNEEYGKLEPSISPEEVAFFPDSDEYQ